MKSLQNQQKVVVLTEVKPACRTGRKMGLCKGTITRALFMLLIFLSSQLILAQWNPNAGLIEPVTVDALIEVSSGDNKATITDGDLQTYWESTNPLPSNYITRKDLNVFLDKDKFSSTNSTLNSGNAFDGITSSKTIVDDGVMEIKFNKPEQLFLLSIKLNTSDTVWITINKLNQKLRLSYSPSENYSLRLIELLNHEKVSSIKLECSKPFEIFEIAGLLSLPTEEVIFDLGSNQSIGWISSRHYNGAGVVSISVFISDNKSSWKEVATLNPMATTFIPQLISPEVTARYIKLKFVLALSAYQKAKIQEFEVYDKFGPFGKPGPVHPAKNTYSQSFGINTFWGWGYNVYSDQLTGETGPWLFNKVAKWARNYHNIDWDITKPTDNPGYANMQLGIGTTSKSWLNWDREYETWKTSGFAIDACIQFNNQYFPDTLWNNTDKEAMQYGAYFAKHFSTSTSLISMVEIGNEPWEYSKPVYRSILGGMSKGLKQNSEKLTILPCAIQAYSVSSGNGNYISKYIDATNSRYLNGLNTHVYSYTYNYNGDRIAVNPEDPRSEVWSVNNLHSFSNSNLSGKPVYVTEFGYDSKGGNEDCIHDVCITEFEQAIYGPRMALIFYRLGAKQFYWYYYANVDYISILHNRSGLTSSYSNGFQKKLSFHSFELLQKLLGNYYFHHIIMETDDAYVYAFSDKDGKIKRVIAWRPTSENHNEKLWVTFPFNEVIERVVPLVSSDKQEEETLYVRGINELKISLSGVPVIIVIR